MPRLPACRLMVLFVLTCPAMASASKDLEVGLEDERLLLSDSHEAPAVVQAWRQHGVELVRLHASWRRIAPGGRRAPARFSARDHQDPHYAWAQLDDAVRLVRVHGMRVMLTIAGPAPHWANLEKGRRWRRWARHGWRPDPRAYADFATAVASRYGRDVHRYSLWNEPNLYLAPLTKCSQRRPRRGCRLEAPHAYRRLVLSAAPAIRRADPRAEVAIGELASIGGPGRIAPLPFLKEMACVTAAFRPRRIGPCRHYRAPRVDALAYHPHSRRWPPDRRTRHPDNARFGDLDRLIAVADALTLSGHIRAPRRRLRIRLTEFGYQTRPPDRVRGVTLSNQARYLQTAMYMAWQHPRIKTLIQYQWRDELVRNAGPGYARYAGWQSGLRFYDDRPKPAARAYARPLVLVRRSRRWLFWGRVAPGRRTSVWLQVQTSQKGWRRLAHIRSNTSGVWRLRLADVRPGRYRAITHGSAPFRASHRLSFPGRLAARSSIMPAL